MKKQRETVLKIPIIGSITVNIGLIPKSLSNLIGMIFKKGNIHV